MLDREAHGGADSGAGWNSTNVHHTTRMLHEVVYMGAGQSKAGQREAEGGAE